jgi:uncharacterized protein YdeI (YjbR/CyaY-like superfamily)
MMDDQASQSQSKRGELPVLTFDTQEAWRAWLEAHHDSSSGVWLRIAKRGAAEATVSYEDAVTVGLCFGWIDGQKRKLDEVAWLQKFTPRGPRSLWSRRNREKAEGLMRSGAMRPAGLREVERARADGRWEAAYDSPRTAEVPDDLQAELDSHPTAKAFFEDLDAANRYAILWRLQTARKPQTRERRLSEFIEMLERREKLHP